MSSQQIQRTNGGSQVTTVNRNNKTPNSKLIIKTPQGARFVNRNSTEGQKYLANEAKKNRKNVANSVMLKNVSKNHLQSCYLNTYTTLAYLAGQSKISDAVIARYIISFETLLSKMNGKLTTDREKIFENMWNKTRNHENTVKFASVTDIEQYLKYYKNIMEGGFKIQGNSRLSTLARNLN
tara:strand:- start:1057 stop:1599 length:543 start_codon:yes stop_codon:yes gene_type:complete